MLVLSLGVVERAATAFSQAARSSKPRAVGSWVSRLPRCHSPGMSRHCSEFPLSGRELRAANSPALCPDGSPRRSAAREVVQWFWDEGHPHRAMTRSRESLRIRKPWARRGASFTLRWEQTSFFEGVRASAGEGRRIPWGITVGDVIPGRSASQYRRRGRTRWRLRPMLRSRPWLDWGRGYSPPGTRGPRR